MTVNSLFETYQNWGEKRPDALLKSLFSGSIVDERTALEVSQNKIFNDDLKYSIHTFSIHLRYEVVLLAQRIGGVVIAIFTPVLELNNIFTWWQHTCKTPLYIARSVLGLLDYCIRLVEKIETTASTSVGFLVWHSGERIVRLVTGDSSTVLSNQTQTRNVVYKSIGITCLAAGMVFVPIAAIQMIALPIILGSIYGTINNQFTLRDCPEYYTMGHYYDGTNLRGHAIKTNNFLIKPIVTGCYATTIVTKYSGLAIAAAGVLPYTSTSIPVPYVASLMIGVIAISLVTAHIFARMQQSTVQNDLALFATITGHTWTEEDFNKPWKKFIESKKKPLDRTSPIFQELTKKINSYTFYTDNLPIKYIAGWQTNNKRNTIGYAFAGGSTLTLTISIIFLRIFVLRA